MNISKKQEAIITYLKKNRNRFVSSREIGMKVGEELTGQIQNAKWTNETCRVLYKRKLIKRSLRKSQWHYCIKQDET